MILRLPTCNHSHNQWHQTVHQNPCSLYPCARNLSDRGKDLTVNHSAKVYMQLQALILCSSLTGALVFLYFKETFKSSFSIDFFFYIVIIILNLALVLLVRIKPVRNCLFSGWKQCKVVRFL